MRKLSLQLGLDSPNITFGSEAAKSRVRGSLAVGITSNAKPLRA